KQMGVALHTFHDQKKFFPSGGEGTSYGGLPGPGPAVGATVFDKQSLFLQLLPFMEQGELYNAYNQNFYYNDTTNAPRNAPRVARSSGIATPTSLSPTNPLRQASGVDSAGYAYTDYGATVHPDIDPTTGGRNKTLRADGALHADNLANGIGQPASAIVDGLS